MNPMIPFTAGCILGCLHKEGSGLMKIVDASAPAPDQVRLSLASGLALRIKVCEETEGERNEYEAAIADAESRS